MNQPALHEIKRSIQAVINEILLGRRSWMIDAIGVAGYRGITEDEVKVIVEEVNGMIYKDVVVIAFTSVNDNMVNYQLRSVQ